MDTVTLQSDLYLYTQLAGLAAGILVGIAIGFAIAWWVLATRPTALAVNVGRPWFRKQALAVPEGTQFGRLEAEADEAVADARLCAKFGHMPKPKELFNFVPQNTYCTRCGFFPIPFEEAERLERRDDLTVRFSTPTPRLT